MKKNKSVTLIIYAVVLLLLGLASVLYNARTGEFGLHWEGKTGLIACGSGAVLACFFGIAARSGKDWPHWAGAILAFLMMIITFNQGFFAGRKLAAEISGQRAAEAGVAPDAKEIEQRSTSYKVYLLFATAGVSLCALLPLLVYLRRERPVKSES